MDLSVTDLNQLKNVKGKIIGLKQTLRAVQQEQVRIVYMANDLEEHVIRKISDSCRGKEVLLIPVAFSQNELGEMCQIEVGAAVVALLK